jgi:hypothetical protein
MWLRRPRPGDRNVAARAARRPAALHCMDGPASHGATAGPSMRFTADKCPAGSPSTRQISRFSARAAAPMLAPVFCNSRACLRNSPSAWRRCDCTSAAFDEPAPPFVRQAAWPPAGRRYCSQPASCRCPRSPFQANSLPRVSAPILPASSRPLSSMALSVMPQSTSPPA